MRWLIMNKHSSVPSVLLIDIEDKLGGIISVEDAVKLGDEILVKALGPDKKGRQNFSRKDAISSPKTKEKKKEKSKEKTK